MNDTLLFSSLNELKQISADIKRNSNVSNLYSRIDALFFDKIKIVNKRLINVKTVFDINWKFKKIPTEIEAFRLNLICLINLTSNLNISVIKKDNKLINKYNELIIETLTDIDNLPNNIYK